MRIPPRAHGPGGKEVETAELVPSTVGNRNQKLHRQSPVAAPAASLQQNIACGLKFLACATDPPSSDRGAFSEAANRREYAMQTRQFYEWSFRSHSGNDHCAQQNPINGYHGYRRAMRRVTLAGDRP